MQILLNPGENMTGSESLTARVEASVESALEHVAARVTRVEVHVAEVNSHKSGDADKRCTMEARIAGLRPIGVSVHAATVADAIDAAAEKLRRAVERTLGRLDETAGRAPREGEIASVERLQRLDGAGRPRGRG